MRGRVQRPSGVIAASLVERAAQRTLGCAEGGASKPRQGTALGPAAHVACEAGLRQAQPERKSGAMHAQPAIGLRQAQPERKSGAMHAQPAIGLRKTQPEREGWTRLES